MSRKRILAYILDDSERKACFKKRKKGLVKKVQEISVLCDVQAFAIISTPFRDVEPEVWPSEEGVRQVFGRFKNMSSPQQTRKKYSLEMVLTERIEKVQAKLLKLAKDNREKEMTELMFQVLVGDKTIPMDLVDLNDLAWVTKKHLQQINERIEAIMRGGSTSMPPPPPPPLAAAAAASSSLPVHAPPAHVLTPSMFGMQMYQGNIGNMLPIGGWPPNVNSNNTQNNHPDQAPHTSNNP